MRKWDVRASYVISSNTNCTKQPYFRFLSAGFYMTVNTHWSLKQCVSHREAFPKTLPASKWRSQVCLWGIHADLGSVLKQFLVMMWVLSLDWGLFLCPTVCQSASVCRAVFHNNIHKIFHAHPQMYTWGGKIETVLQLQDTGICPPSSPPPSWAPGNKKESPTRYEQSRFSISIDFFSFFCSSIFLYKHVFNRFTHEKRVQDCGQSKRAPHRLENTACLGAQKMATYENQSLSWWLQWSLIYTSCKINEDLCTM